MKRFMEVIVGIIIVTVLLQNTAYAVTLRKGHPTSYEVQPGDTLWSIAGKFLSDPIEWPLLMHSNPNIHNPDKIYPGEVLELEIINGQPALRVHSGGTVKLSPQIRTQSLDDAIPSIPYRTIAPFLSNTRIVEQDTLNKAASVIAHAGEHVAVGAGDQIYIQGLVKNDMAERNATYSLFRLGAELIDPETHKVLGYEASHVGDVEVLHQGDPATALVTSANREVLVGDKVLPFESVESEKSFELSLPLADMKGQIINVLDGITQIGQYQVVVVNRGRDQGVKIGNVFAVYQAGKLIANPQKNSKQKTIQLPDERAGELMIFRVFDKTSFGLIMQAARPIHLLDKIRSPNVG